MSHETTLQLCRNKARRVITWIESRPDIGEDGDHIKGMLKKIETLADSSWFHAQVVLGVLQTLPELNEKLHAHQRAHNADFDQAEWSEDSPTKISGFIDVCESYLRVNL